MNIILCGHHGCGKTTIAQQFAKQYQYDLLDTDQLLCAKFNNPSVRTLFQQLGEQRFRIAEQQLIINLTLKKNTIIATGGGSLLNQQSVHHLKKLGTMVYLANNEQQLLQRLLAQPSVPAFIDPENIESHFKEYFQSRANIYHSVADHIIESADRSIDDIVLDLNNYRYSYGE